MTTPGSEPPELPTVRRGTAAARKPAPEGRPARQELAAASQFEALFEQAPVAMITVSAELGTRHNRAALELFGRERDELVRLAFTQGAPWIPDGEEGPWLDIRRRVAGGDPVSGARMTLLRPTGERRDIEVSAFPYLAPDGSRAGLVTVLLDLTDRNSLEAQLRHAQKMEALGRLAGGIAHDFNNVLMAILGYAEFIVQDAKTGSVRLEDAEQVLAATNRAIELTARLTQFARRGTSSLESVDVSDLVRSLLPLLERLAPESIELVSHLEPAPPVMVDRSEFDQVLVNLVVNAVDAMPDGGRLTIEVGSIDVDSEHASTRPGEKPGEYALIAVSDSGIGMDEATRARIFEPFYTTKPVGVGTGLGLSTAFAFVQRAGGRIWVYSEPGHGSTFRVYLPRVAEEALAPTAPPAAEIARPRGSESILLLEDDVMVRSLVADVLVGLGYDVTAVGLPSEAIEAASGRAFDLLVTDIVMPEMMGDALATRLRSMNPDLRVVFMTGYTARALEFELGPNDSIVHKPVRSSDLARTVRAALDAR